MKTRILLVDDHTIVREGLRSLLSKERDMEVVADASDGNQALSTIGRCDPDVVVMDISLPNLNGIEATRRIAARFPGIKVLALSMHSDKQFVLRMFQAGAAGYLLKECAFEELAKAIRTIASEQVYLSSKIADILVKNYVRTPMSAALSRTTTLTEREHELLQLLAEGKSMKQVATHLNRSIKTIETHRNRLMRKLNIRTFADLVKYAIREGVTSLDS